MCSVYILAVTIYLAGNGTVCGVCGVKFPVVGIINMEEKTIAGSAFGGAVLTPLNIDLSSTQYDQIPICQFSLFSFGR